jgi:hypothetical protein
MSAPTPHNPDMYRPNPDHHEPRDRQLDVLASIQRKQREKLPKVDHNGHPLPDGSKRYGQQ